MSLHDYLVVMVGVGLIVFGCMTSKFYYVKGINMLSSKRAPTWVGRAIFVTAGFVFIAVGLKPLFI